MAATKEIKRRIQSVKNTKKITKAMELVAASKMKRAVDHTVQSRPYSEFSIDILQSIANSVDSKASMHPLFMEPENDSILVVLITSNRGLCGAYNTQVIRSTIQFMREHEDKKIDFITVGRKGDGSIRRLGQHIVASFTEFPEQIQFRDILPITNLASDLFRKKEYGSIWIASTNFISALNQKPELKQILPIPKASIDQKIKKLDSKETSDENKKPTKSIDYIFEPQYETLIEKVVDKLLKAQIFHSFLESIASEQSSRMVAMKNASDAAGEMIDDLTLAFNKARQSNITREISEISAGMASVS